MKQQTIVERIFEEHREEIYNEFLKYIGDKKDIRVIKCMEMKSPGKKPTLVNIEEADSIRIYKAPKAGRIRIKATFTNPQKNANMCVVYYKDQILTQHRFNTWFVGDTCPKLDILEEICWDHSNTSNQK